MIILKVQTVYFRNRQHFNLPTYEDLYKTTKQNDTGHLALELPNFIEVIDWHLVFHKYIDIKDYPTGT